MLVKNWMSKSVITIDADDSMSQAISLIREHKIRMLPVLRKGKLVGVLSNTDLKRASASDATSLDVHELLYLISKVKVKDIMTKEIITIPFDFTVEEAALLLIEKKISGAPVVDEKGRLVGIITRDDLLKVLISLSGFGKKGIQFALQIEDRPGSIKDVTDIIRSYGGRIASVLGTYESAPAGFRRVYVRAYDIERERMEQLKEELKQAATMLYMVDHRENKREIYS
ncbi:CBS and ACT domain-containing protein [Desulforhabdus amnigena]|uniref:Membrane protein n=1 Tax=Desulforhabdus amnigena TaxID=40218 RepID=A0A9W6D1J5_9BACT|nr:CBS and ACT domain-containing protein [Desulforhabdus amnigena]NLJ27285.1 CBS domain-containing protein [Deltaproteobacteria bacterium]GLI32933.1 membrane protein [Desulforhabdus amnigena]